MANPPPLLEMRHIAKRFGATQALRDVSLSVHGGEVLALIGENGAGKSTLMKVLSGAHAADAGQMLIDGRPFAPRGPGDARQAGVAMIYQELTLALDLSVEDNIMLGREIRHAAVLCRGAQRRRVRQALALLGHHELRPEIHVRRLSVAARQLVEIARALVFDARLIVFDEPTSSLTQHDVRHLYRVIRTLRGQGIGVVYISHFLEEIREVCDRYAVLRDGASVGEGAVATASEPEIVSLMVGRSVADLFPTVPHSRGEPILTLDGVSGTVSPQDVSLTLHRGEILGIAGLVGAGRTELLRVIYGLDPLRSGSVCVDALPAPTSPRARIRAGMGMVSEDRKNEGLAQALSIAENVTASRLRPYSRWGLLAPGAVQRAAERWMRTLSIKARTARQPVSSLSGGNQQKVALARVMHQQAEILLLDEPTRGIDVGTKAEIYRLVGQLAADGKAIIFVSSYLPELLAVCDRVGVMARGRLREIRPVKDWTEESVMACAISAAEVVESDAARAKHGE